MANVAQTALNSDGMGNLGNLVTGGLSDAPQYQSTYLDPLTQQVIANQTAQGNQSQQQIAQNELAGTNSQMPSAVGGAVGRQQSTLGGSGNDAVSQALNNRAQRIYDSQYNQLQNQAIANAPNIQGQLVNTATGSLQQQQNIANQQNTQQMQAIAAQNQLRNQVVSQLFMGAGNFAGSMAANQKQNTNSPQTQDQVNQMNNDQNLNPVAPQIGGGQFDNSQNSLGVNYGQPQQYGGPSLLDQPQGQTGYGMQINPGGFGLGYSRNGGG